MRRPHVHRGSGYLYLHQLRGYGYVVVAEFDTEQFGTIKEVLRLWRDPHDAVTPTTYFLEPPRVNLLCRSGLMSLAASNRATLLHYKGLAPAFRTSLRGYNLFAADPTSRR